MSSERIAALRKAIDSGPDNHLLRLMLAEALAQAGQVEEAVEQYETLLHAGHLPPESLVSAGELALKAGHVDLATRYLDAALRAGVVEGVAALQAKLSEKLADAGILRLAQAGSQVSPATPAQGYIENYTRVTFADVGGLEAVKKIIHRMIILPFLRPEIYQKYGKQAGGAVMLYGPPGCGKTLLARATAGECNLPFFNIRIENVLDPWFGVSEKNLHEAFAQARAYAPCVVFIDELDAIAYARHKQHGSVGRALVDQMLQELDSIGADNRDLLILAATNAPWDVDNALLRPGRFDRRIFVPPPDNVARIHILKLMLTGRPTASLDLERLAKSTSLFSGADLRALVEQAIDWVIEETLETGQDLPLAMKHLEATIVEMRPSTIDWLVRARNYVEFSNQDDRYKDLAVFLRTPEVKKWKE